MKHIILSLLFGSICLFSCRKSAVETFSPKVSCIPQKEDPAGRSYPETNVVPFYCSTTHCGLIPLNTKNYWVYQDSIFENGVFAVSKMDTLRYSKTWITVPDGVVWWQGNISVGLPSMLYASDSALYLMNDRLFTLGVKDVKKEYSLFQGDSIRYLTSFEDAAAFGRSVKMDGNLQIPCGVFKDYILYEKNARFYKKEQLLFKPGIGVLKYISEKAPMGSMTMQLQRISTLVSYHLE